MKEIIKHKQKEMPMPTPAPNHYDDDNKALLLYRMDVVEVALKDLTNAVSNRETITKTDLNEFRDVIVGRITEVNGNLQSQINELKDDKAEKSDVENVSRLLWWGLGIIGSALASIVAFVIKGN